MRFGELSGSGRSLAFLVALVGALCSWVAPASAAVTVSEGADTVVTPKFEWDFGNQGFNVEWVEGLKWKGAGSGTFGPNLAAASGVAGGGCGGAPNEFWGQSYGNADGQGPGPVIAANHGSWDRRGQRTIEISTVSPEICSGDTPPVPVRTRYSFFDEGASANTVRVERRFSFSPTQEPYSVQGVRAYVPRLPVSTYNQEIYPKDDGSLVTEGICDVCIRTGSLVNDWNQTWVALNASGSNAGLLILRAAGNASPASVTLDYDGSSGANNTGVTLDRPLPNGWQAPLSETEFLCFYDATSWPPAERSATRLPDGCAPAAVPVNTQPPALSAGAGNPRPGENFYASPGTWENTTGVFTYQWSRCLEDACTPIAGATGTAYTATGADAGHSLKVSVTAIAPGGETDVAESNIAGAISGRVYEGSRKTGPLVAGAAVQVCRRSGSPCRSTVTNALGFYRVQAPLVGKYRVTAFPPAGSTAVARTRTTITRVKAETEKTDQDVVLGAVKLPPPQVSFGGAGVRGKSAEGVPVVHWQEPFVIDYETDIDNEVEARVEFADGKVLRLDPLQPVLPSPKDPENGIFKFAIEPLFPNHGAARVTIVFHAPRSQAQIELEEQEAEEEEAEEEEESEEEEDEEEENEEEDEEPEEEEENEEEESEEEEDEETEEDEEEEQEEDEENAEEEETTFPIYIDPSGYVRNVDGSPLGGAKVTLFQSQLKSGPFTVVANGSAVMSPMNRINPDLSEADGHFGWDVIAGYYKVRVEKSGCHAPGAAASTGVETEVMTIPPPVTNLDLRLECPLVGDPGPGGSNGGGGGSSSPPSPVVVLSLRGGTVKVGKDGSYAVKTATIGCPAASSGPCAAEIVVSAAAAKKKGSKASAKKTLGLGSSRLSIAAGKSAAVAGKLSKGGLRTLTRLRRLKATFAVAASAPGGKRSAGSFPVTLLAPPKPKHRAG